jgi:hypothetical protein
MFIKMAKNITITVLSILAVLLWLNNDPNEVSEDPDDVTIEYKCSVIREYRHVPPEVLEECKRRSVSPKEIDDNSTT